MADYAALVRAAWEGLYPDEPLPYVPRLRYSGRFTGLNANIRLGRGVLTVGMSKQWRTIDRSIQIGLIQELIGRVRKDRVRTPNIDMYRIFLKHAHLGVAKTKSDPVLEASFDRVNEEYFGGLLEKPNLVWSSGTQRLGFYDYGRDQIALSTILAKDSRLLDYVMYHEMLHKKHKFTHSSSRALHHGRAFREDERKFKDAALLEGELTKVVRRARWRRVLWG